MFTEIWERFEAIEECYEFMLGYAAQGLPNELGSQSGGQVREFLNGAVEALDGLAEAYAAAAHKGKISKERTDSRRSWRCWTAMRALHWRLWNWCLLSPRSALN